jgi:crotonobetainyl-CoA:carnitine CoA-transferase CaiB-like acyl-CoA transferase
MGVIVVGRVVDLPDVIKNDHYRDRGTLAVFTDPTYGDLLIQFPFQKMSASPPRLKWTCRAPGQDNAHVYAKHLGLGRETLADLGARKIV